MGIMFFLFYILIVIYIVRYIFKFVKSFGGDYLDRLNNFQKEMMDGQIPQRTVHLDNTVESEANLDDFMKTNTNPIKEKRGKRSNI